MSLFETIYNTLEQCTHNMTAKAIHRVNTYCVVNI